MRAGKVKEPDAPVNRPEAVSGDWRAPGDLRRNGSEDLMRYQGFP